MDQAIRQKIAGKPRILVAPLDWGLGHTTRCIPIVRELLAYPCEVLLAGNDQQAALFVQEFPGLPVLPLEGYNIRYGASPASLVGSIIFQVPKLLNSIRREQEWLRSACNQYAFDAVISDNRYGLYHESIPTIFITHQLNIMSGLGAFADRILRKKNYIYIHRFTQCWVPDHESNDTLAGTLSHPPELPRTPVNYIGPLSRLKNTGQDTIPDHLLVILSGPEPQRSIFEKLLMRDLQQYRGTATVVRGLPGETQMPSSTDRIIIHNHLPASALENEMTKAAFVIGRCGYSSVMDIASLRKKSILVPTPGQGEQEYLAQHLAKMNFTVAVKQKDFNLEKALVAARAYQYLLPGSGANENSLKKIVGEFLNKLRIAIL